MLPIRKRKSIGQHLLINKEILNKIVDFIYEKIPNQNYTLFEIGSANGTLTIPLLQKLSNKKPITIILNEIDYRYLKILKQKLKELDYNIKFVESEFQNYIFTEDQIFLVGNIPFYITGIVLRKIIQNYSKIIGVVLNMQKEVVDKICNTDNAMGKVFSIGWQIEKGPIIHPKFYDPCPKVFSQILYLKNLNNPIFSEKLANFIFKIYKNKNKILSNILTKIEIEKIQNKQLIQKRPLQLTQQEILTIYNDINQINTRKL